jgi:predicted acylesterase/phospholipase RssA
MTDDVVDRDLPARASTALPRRRQLLALSGGGYRGLFSAIVLEELEAFAGKPLAHCFDLIAGTSVGGLLASAIAVEVPVRRVRETLEEHAPAIFPKVHAKRLRQLAGTIYDSQALRTAITLTLGAHAQTRLIDITKPLLLPAVSWVTGKTLLLASDGIAGPLASPLTLLDAALATSAAPTYFPPHDIQGDVLLDGGLTANAPDIAALSFAQRRWATGLASTYMLSVGTAGASAAGMAGKVPKSGVAWMYDKLIPLIMEAQENLAAEQCAMLLDQRYLRLNPVPGPGHAQLSAFDVVDVSMTQTLHALGHSSFRDAKARHLGMLNKLCGHSA